ncbi:DUF2752 domain-containing protein [Halalkalibaculum sp. DA3122]|uniref:DUF2752 domain-containing protein n=1 Tax=unclassified Halalkalibaculum TaxID=2964617 RepID=UPI0037546236
MDKHFFRDHFEWVALLTGLVLLGLMNPYADDGFSFCFFEMANLKFCPGQGLGHSIAYFFRGEWRAALQAHPFGPAAVLILAGRICCLWRKLMFGTNPVNSMEV